MRGDPARQGHVHPPVYRRRQGLPVFSLYGKDSKRLTPPMLETFDVLVYDIQDVGSPVLHLPSPRWPTSSRIALKRASGWWCWTAPDPLGGEIIEVQLCAPGMESFVGCYPAPLATP